MRIELLKGSFPVSENPGLDSTDPRFDEIATLIQNGKHAVAASLCEAILADGIYDIRLMCYFLYGYWLEEGLTSLIDVIHCLNNVLVDNWDATGPLTRREKILEKSLDWLFKQLLKKLQYEENKNTKLWQQWQSHYNEVEINQILESGGAIRSAINNRLEEQAGAIVGLWSKIEAWLKVFQRLAYQPPKPLQKEPEPIEDDEPTVDLHPAITTPTSGLEIESSYHMELLLQKLDAFERLLQDKKYPKAALLADDINQTLDNFDPKLYFPKIFQAFIRLQAVNFEALVSYAEQRDELQWQLMQDWLKVDIDGFINS